VGLWKELFDLFVTPNIYIINLKYSKEDLAEILSKYERTWQQSELYWNLSQLLYFFRKGDLPQPLHREFVMMHTAFINRYKSNKSM
jgi:hypothetical protein